MKIYLAGIVQHGVISENSASENYIVQRRQLRTYPFALDSYHYIGYDPRYLTHIRETQRSVFLDSGAFSMFTKGIKVDLSAYADFIKANQDCFHVASNLDVIGRGAEEETYANQKALEKMGAAICPVHHARDADRWLQRYMADGYDYIFLGGMVAEPTPYLRGWLDHVWGRYLTRRDGSAKIRVHGFGLTTLELIERYPWYSVDSTSWILTSRYGGIHVDLPNGRDTKLSISSDSSAVYQFDRHYDTLSPLNRGFIDEYIRAQPTGEPPESGLPSHYDPELLRTHYGWRDHWNIAFFRRLGERLNPTFNKRQIDVFD